MTTRQTSRLLIPVVAVLVVAGGAGTEAMGAPTDHSDLPSLASFSAATVAAVTEAPHSSMAWAIGTGETAAQTASNYALRRVGNVWHKKVISAPADTTLLSVAAGSPTSVWAVGNDFSGDTMEALVEHSTGGAFRPMSTHLGPGQLISVSASSPSDAWAVGDARTGPAQFIVHWNGRSWKELSEPQITGAPFQSVSASSPTNVWFLGDGFTGPVVARWNGRKMIEHPLHLPSGTTVSAITTTGANDAWAVGTSTVGGNRLHTRNVTEHWNGRRWRAVAAPNPGYFIDQQSISAAGSRLYVSETVAPMSMTTSKAAILSYARGKWKTVSLAAPGPQTTVSSLSVSTRGAAAVGTWTTTGSGENELLDRPFAETLSGKVWRLARLSHLVLN
jgi:hypothetical protein